MDQTRTEQERKDQTESNATEDNNIATPPPNPFAINAEAHLIEEHCANFVSETRAEQKRKDSNPKNLEETQTTETLQE